MPMMSRRWKHRRRAWRSGNSPANPVGPCCITPPGTNSLACTYCGAVNEIDEKRDAVGEQDFNTYFARALAEAQTQEHLTVHCKNCGAETTLKPDVTADRCPFCGASVVAEGSSKKLIRPQALLPFYITKDQAAQAFGNWIAGLWFVANELARRARQPRSPASISPHGPMTPRPKAITPASAARITGTAKPTPSLTPTATPAPKRARSGRPDGGQPAEPSPIRSTICWCWPAARCRSSTPTNSSRGT